MKKKWMAVITAMVMMAMLLTACGGGVSDKTYETLQQNWKALTEFYNQIASEYNTMTSDGTMERDEAFETLMNQAADLLEEIQNTPKADLTEDKAIELNDKMIKVQEDMTSALGMELVD